MAFPKDLDFDKFMITALAEIGAAVSGWLKGRPLDEVALLNRLTERLGRTRRGCDVGVSQPVSMHAKVYLLHRKGPNQTDSYGSDLAITAYTQDLSFFKTALFQLKKSDVFSLSLEKRQLLDSLSDPRTAPRSFVLAADEARQAIRIRDAKSILSEYSGSEKTKSFNSMDWDCLTEWCWEWLSCNRGVVSNEGDPNSVESLLQNYVISEETGYTPWGRNVDIEAFKSEAVAPVRTWQVMEFVKQPEKKQ